MGRLLAFLLIVPILLCSQANVMVDLFSEVSMVEIYKDGEVYLLNQEQQKEFDEIFCEIMEGAIQKPAFAVSLDDLTKEEMKSGFWVKFIFDNTMFKSEMPFDELLFNVTENAHGVNIIRGNDGIYQGRCYYLDLEGTMNMLYDFISQLSMNEQEDIEIELESQEIQPTIIVSEDKENDNNSEKDNSLRANDGKNAKKSDTVLNEESNNKEESLTKSQKELLERLQ